MKLITYDVHGEPTPGVVRNGRVLDLRGHLVRSILELLETPEAMERVRHADTAFSGQRPALDTLRLLPPVTGTRKILCIGQNYADHVAEQNKPLPEHLILFAKFPTCLTGHDAPVVLPRGVTQLDYEAELVIVIGAKAKRVSKEKALDYVAGYTIGNDISARDVQFRDVQWVRGKSYDTFAPTGPCLVTRDEIPDPHNLGIRCYVNGELRQDSNTRNLVFDVPTLVSNLSEGITLEPGDLIFTGTPGGVGMWRDPPAFLQPGDVVTAEIDSIGALRNTIVAEED